MKKQENKSEKHNSFLPIALMLLAAMLAKGVMRSCVSQVRRDISNQKIEAINEDMNKKFNKFETAEEALNAIKKEVKDNEITGVAVPMGFFMSVDLIQEFCAPTGYIPKKYIATINSYHRGDDLDKKLVDILIRMGGSKEQAQYATETQKKTIKNQLARFLENDYREVLKLDPTFTKKQYCELYDEHAEEIVADKLKNIQETTPEAYKNYFIK